MTERFSKLLEIEYTARTLYAACTLAAHSGNDDRQHVEQIYNLHKILKKQLKEFKDVDAR